MSVSGLLARGNGMGGGFTPEQEAALLPKVARGEYLGAYALSEAEAGSDVANISCRATRDGDDWVISGTKMWCTYADEADYLVLFARTDPNKDPAKPHRGISAFLIEKQRGGFPEGISGTKIRKIGYFGWSTWELSFDNFRVPARWGGRIPRPARSVWRGARWRIRSRICTPADSSGTSWPIFSICGSRSRRWPPTSRPPGN
jgi:butyryl-CoA dehydrogenase